MKIQLIAAPLTEIQIAFDLLSHASEQLERKGINQWHYWQDPPKEKMDWILAGFESKEFYFIKNELDDVLGMVRISNEDLLYWGEQIEKTQYIHSLVVHADFAGRNIGRQVVGIITQQAKEKNCEYLRLDCDASNPALCKYYTHQGFNKVGEKKLALGTYNLFEKEI